MSRTMQYERPSLQAERRRKADAATVIQRLFPDLAGVSKRLRYAISRARNGRENALYRVADYLAEARRVGAPRVRAEAVRAYIDSLIEELWGPGGSDLRAALVAEQQAEGRSNVLQLRAMAEPAALALWVEAEEAEIAAARAAIAEARRRLSAPRSQAA